MGFEQFTEVHPYGFRGRELESIDVGPVCNCYSDPLMASSGNKVRLQKLVKEHMTVSRFGGSIIYCEGETSTNQSTDMASTDFEFQHTMQQHCMLEFGIGRQQSAYAKLVAENDEEVVVIDSEDTDMYVQAAYVSHKLQGNLLIKRKNEYISCSAMLSEDYRTSSCNHRQ